MLDTLITKYRYHLQYPPYLSAHGFLGLAWMGWVYLQMDIFYVNLLIWITGLGNHSYRSAHSGWYWCDVIFVHSTGVYYLVYSILTFPLYPYVLAEWFFAFLSVCWFHWYRTSYAREWGQSVVHMLAICGQIAYILGYDSMARRLT